MDFTAGKETISVNVPDRDALFDRVRRCWRAGQGFALATINLDHLVKLSRDAGFRAVYAGQDMVVADGRPIVWLSRLAGRPVELMPGSDLVHPLARLAAEENAPVGLVGSSPEALNDASAALSAAALGLDIRYVHSPEFGFDPAGAEADRILTDLEAAGVRLCFVALGAPKQESLALRGRKLAPSVGFASIGAGLDFLGGHQVRAPLWMRKLALEWLWRALSSPRRLVPRYLACAAILPRLTLQAVNLRRAGGRN